MYEYVWVFELVPGLMVESIVSFLACNHLARKRELASLL